MDFYISLTPEQIKRVETLSSEFGYWIWNVIVLNAPIDTGNLRRSIFMVKNTGKEKRYSYNLLLANYIRFLEEGVGPVKKHKGFISNQTMTSVLMQTLKYLYSGSVPQGAITTIPKVTLTKSKKPFKIEREMLFLMGKNNNVITPNQRRSISIIREKNFLNSQNEKPKLSGGLKPQTNFVRKIK